MDFHYRVIFKCVRAFANKMAAMYQKSRENVKVESRFTAFLSYFKTLSVGAPGSPHLRGSKTVLDSRFHSVDSGFQVLDLGLCQWNLDSGFQSLMGFRIS